MDVDLYGRLRDQSRLTQQGVDVDNLWTTTIAPRYRFGTGRMLIPEEERLLFRLEPTPANIQAAQDNIRSHEQAIDEIEARIQRLAEQTRGLRYEQARHRAAIERSFGIITLARRLPEELLIKIFCDCVEDGWTRAPVVVSHVCSAWRKAALAPKVWSHVYVRCDDANVVQRTRFWLNMAKAAELHVTVTATWRVPQWQIHDVMTLVMELSAQWRSIKIETETLLHLSYILAEFPTDLPQLRQVSIAGNSMLPDAADVLGIDVLPRLADVFNAERAPNLTTVIYDSHVVPAVPIFPMHVTTLSLVAPAYHSLSASAILTVLEPLMTLQTLTLSMPLHSDYAFIPEPNTTRTVSLSSLKTLTVHGPEDLNDFLPHIHAPALRALRLRSLEDTGYRLKPIAPSLVRFLHESSPPLELLELHDIDLDPHTFATCFAALPELCELRLHESSISLTTLRLLNAGGLCPRLRRVDFRWCGMLQGCALVDLVESRRGGGDSDPIEEVGVINCCFVMEADVLALARMTVCRIITRLDGDDYCKTRGCCSNGRYRTRLRLRHMNELADRDAGIRLVL